MDEKFPKIHLFISYSHVEQDKRFVKQLVGKLETSYGKTNVWYDKELVGGKEWIKKIDEEILKCNIFIYVLSEDSLKSSQCHREFKLASELGKSFVPILLRGDNKLFVSAPEDVKEKLEPLQYVDMTKGFKDNQAFESLVRAITEIWSQYLEIETLSEKQRLATQEQQKVSVKKEPFISCQIIIGIFTVVIVFSLAGIFFVPKFLGLISVPTSTATQNSAILTLTPTLSPTSALTDTLTPTPKSTYTHTPTRPIATTKPEIAATETFAALDTRQAARLTPTHTPTPLPTCTPTPIPQVNSTPDKTATSKFETLEARLDATEGATLTPLLAPLLDKCTP